MYAVIFIVYMQVNQAYVAKMMFIVTVKNTFLG